MLRDASGETIAFAFAGVDERLAAAEPVIDATRIVATAVYMGSPVFLRPPLYSELLLSQIARYPETEAAAAALDAGLATDPAWITSSGGAWEASVAAATVPFFADLQAATSASEVDVFTGEPRTRSAGDQDTGPEGFDDSDPSTALDGVDLSVELQAADELRVTAAPQRRRWTTVWADDIPATWVGPSRLYTPDPLDVTLDVLEFFATEFLASGEVLFISQDWESYVAQDVSDFWVGQFVSAPTATFTLRVDRDLELAVVGPGLAWGVDPTDARVLQPLAMTAITEVLVPYIEIAGGIPAGQTAPSDQCLANVDDLILDTQSAWIDFEDSVRRSVGIHQLGYRVGQRGVGGRFEPGRDDRHRSRVGVRRLHHSGERPRHDRRHRRGHYHVPRRTPWRSCRSGGPEFGWISRHRGFIVGSIRRGLVRMGRAVNFLDSSRVWRWTG